MKFNLRDLGLSEVELRNHLVDRLCADDGDVFDAKFQATVQKEIEKRINETVLGIGEKFVLPTVKQAIEDIRFTKTNQWGEAKGEPQTFREYLVKKADDYITEKVNYEGKAQTEAGGYSWTPAQTRIAHMIHQHLHYHIHHAMEAALKDINSKIAKGIEETVKLKLEEVLTSLKIAVK